MQPNQQDPDNRNQPIEPTSPAPVQLDPYGRPLPPEFAKPAQQEIPEYLHMDPVVDPVGTNLKKRKKTKKLIITIAIILLLTLISILVYLYFDYNSPREQFYRALKKTMGITYVSRDYRMINEDTSTHRILLNLKSDFSKQSRPISEAKYELEDPLRKTAVKGEQVIESSSKFSSKILHSNIAKNAQYPIGQWYGIDTNKPPKLSSRTIELFDPLALRREANTPASIILFAISSQTQQDKIIKEMQGRSIFTITSSGSQEISGVLVDRYDVKVNAKELSVVVDKFAEQNGQKMSKNLLSPSDMKSDAVFWVNKRTGEVQKIDYSIDRTYINPALKVEMTIKSLPDQRINIPDAKNI